MVRIDHLRISWSVILIAALISGLGCRQEKANIHIEGKTVDAIRTPGASSPVEGPAVRVVIGEPAITADGKKMDGTTAEDKPGAAALKMQY